MTDKETIAMQQAHIKHLNTRIHRQALLIEGWENDAQEVRTLLSMWRTLAFLFAASLVVIIGAVTL
jgi:hypothetical protein